MILVLDNRDSFTFNEHEDGAAMLYAIVKTVKPDTRTGCSNVKVNLEKMTMKQFSNNVATANAQIVEWMDEIELAGDTFDKLVRHQFNVYETLTCQAFKDYIQNKRDEWEDDKNFTAREVRALALKKYNNLTESGRWVTKDPNDAKIVALVGVSEKLAKQLDSSKGRTKTKSDQQQQAGSSSQSYHRNLPQWRFEIQPTVNPSRRKPTARPFTGATSTATARACGSATRKRTTRGMATMPMPEALVAAMAATAAVMAAGTAEMAAATAATPGTNAALAEEGTMPICPSART